MSAAGRVELVMNILYPPIYDEDGNIVGYQEVGFIARKQALMLLDMPDINYLLKD